jgi:hypothetical protein
VLTSETGFVRLIWADYPTEVKSGHVIKGFRIYRSNAKGELGERIADESELNPDTFQFDDTQPDAGSERKYVCVAVEETGFGSSPFGQTPHGEPDSTGFSLLPFNSRPFGSPRRGWGEGAFGQESYGI